ncbi:HAMP domain-containing sensor histidine kinase [Nocardia sp. NPDC051832]|uniref:HAMP domain-containing sensor histidine kinase n=1 Tax=Nocardia sp. NPDC051832 TaxID=3155673 RepID=UPI0034407B32
MTLRRFSLRQRVAILAATAAALLATAMAVGAFLLFQREVHRQVDQTLVQAATSTVRAEQHDTWTPEQAGTCRWLTSPPCSRFVSATTDSAAETDDAALAINDPERAVARNGTGRLFEDREYRGYPVRVLTSAVDDGRAVQVWTRTDSMSASIRTYAQVLALGVLAAVALACTAGYLVTRIGLRPLGNVAAVARRVARTADPDEHLPVHGNDELADLSTSFNDMLAALGKAQAAQRQLVADASHELRTPLTALRSDVELLSAAGLPEVSAERARARMRSGIDNMTELVTNLLDLARIDEAGLRPDRELLPLEDVVEQAVARYPHAHIERDLPPLDVYANRTHLLSLLTNLLDNALKYGAPPVVISLRDQTLSIADHGPGIADADASRIFDRFYRSPDVSAVPGSGLGLAIVARVAQTHGIAVTTHRTEPSGLTVALTFPVPQHN